jgi:chemotaxis protein methyltransferase WspC
MHSEAPYDFIFCRNVLIYFDRDVQMQAVDMLEGLLHERGGLFVGPSEAGLLLRPHIESIGIPMSFGFRRKTVRPQVAILALPASPALPQSFTKSSPNGAASNWMPLPTMAAPSLPVANVTSAQQVSKDLLTRARASADRGELEQAVALCEQQLRHAGPNAEVYYLQGLIRDAQKDDATALQLYRKAIYLQPDHCEALLHLAALLATHGDTSAALRLQQRAERTRLTVADKEQSHA